MTKEQMALARRAVACRGFRWMPGMHTANEERVIGVMRDGVLHLCAPLDAVLESVSITRVFFDSSGSCLPDLTDSATLGCLLALVREAWGAPYAQVSPIIWDDGRGGWVFYVNDVDDREFHDDTEAEALVAALEAAP
jgi:hypothetical protein